MRRGVWPACRPALLYVKFLPHAYAYALQGVCVWSAGKRNMQNVGKRKSADVKPRTSVKPQVGT